MGVETHREKIVEQKRNPHFCWFCTSQPVKASYWSQYERPDGQPQGTCVWHCQSHRSNGRRVAEFLNDHVSTLHIMGQRPIKRI